MNIEPDFRQQSAQQFAQTHLTGEVRVRALRQDASFRRYFRVMSGNRHFILMDAPPEKENLTSFIRIDEHLEKLSLCVPRIFARDLKQGFLLLEDFGDQTFTRLLAEGGDERTLYQSAADTLVALNQHEQALQIEIPVYDVSEMLRETCLFVEWYHRLVFGGDAPEDLKQTYREIWTNLILSQPAPAMSLVLRDFHVDNLMQVERHGVSRCGLLDFQDALIGPMAYDLMSLLQDARRDLSAGLEPDLLSYYFSRMPLLDQDNFMSWYQLLAAQRHTKVLGIFSRLWLRDNKPLYLKHLPRVTRLLEASLNSPALHPLREFLDQHYPKRHAYRPPQVKQRR